MDLTDKVILVTGAARRVGGSIARDLAAAGAHVVVHYRESETEARALVAEIRAAGGAASAQQADLLDLVETQRMVRNVEVDVGYVDALVNNASEFFETPLFTASDEHWDRLLDVNLKAPFRLARRIASTMLNRGHGKIVNIADIHGERPLKDHLVYSVSKAGLLMLTRSLALELAPTVQVNAVSPGAVLWPSETTETEKDEIRGAIPLGREGSPDDVARAVRFLLESDYVTGDVLNVDGGRLLT